MDKITLDALGKAMGITTTLTGPQRISLLQAQATDRLAAALESLASENVADGPRVDRLLNQTQAFVDALPKP